MQLNTNNYTTDTGGFMIAALVPHVVSMTSSLDCSYSFHYFCLLMSKEKNNSLSLSHNDKSITYRILNYTKLHSL